MDDSNVQTENCNLIRLIINPLSVTTNVKQQTTTVLFFVGASYFV
jgi:hypothetical protein